MRILLKNMATSRIDIILIKICCFRQITHINEYMFNGKIRNMH